MPYQEYDFPGVNIKQAQEAAKLNSLYLNPRTFSQLPTGFPTNTMAIITDSTTKTLGATISGGGSFVVLGTYDGSNWKVSMGIGIATIAVWG